MADSFQSLDRACEWLEWVRINGRGAPLDHATILLDLIDDQDRLNATDNFSEEIAEIVGWPDDPTNQTDLDQLRDEIERNLILLDEIRQALTDAGAIDATSDIPKTLRLLLGP